MSINPTVQMLPVILGGTKCTKEENSPFHSVSSEN